MCIICCTDGVTFYSNWENAALFNEEDAKYDEYEQYISSDNLIFFVTETAEVYYDVYTEQGEYQTYGSCSHTYTSGVITEHIKNSSGGCKVDYYDGKCCNKCGYVVYGDFIKSVSYGTCPH